MDYLWIAAAFGCGFLAKQLKLPPLVGYLLAGFGLSAVGVKPNPNLEHLGELGITLLLFAIGLKLNVRTLFKKEIWGTALSHMAIIISLTTVNSLCLGYIGFAYFSDLTLSTALILGFSVSFSSTVCAVKVLEDRGEVRARHGEVAIGILIIQDLLAVIFLSLVSPTPPTIWALCLLGLPLIRPLLYRLLDLCAHGELMPLVGFFIALSGAMLFKTLGLKADLGALVFALLIYKHNKSNELAKSLLHFKDLFLIGFFLSIGFTALPTANMLSAAAIMALCMPFKASIFFFIMTKLKLRARSAFLASLSLANYSEFGLIVCAVCVQQGLLDKAWLVILALAVTFSFIFTSIINRNAHALYQRWLTKIKAFESTSRLIDDSVSKPTGATVLIIGMGRVGTGAYESLKSKHEITLCGIDLDRERVAKHGQSGREVIVGDAEDPDFWLAFDLNTVKLIMLAIPKHDDIIEVVKQLRLANYQGKTAGIVRYEDEKRQLQDKGIDVAFNLYAKAGAGFAEQSMNLYQ